MQDVMERCDARSYAYGAMGDAMERGAMRWSEARCDGARRDAMERCDGGKKQTDGNTGDTEQKTRPLKVVMKDTNKKMELFKRLSNLRDAEDKYKCISIQHDLTKKEREEGTKLPEEARTKEINDEGKWLYRVRG